MSVSQKFASGDLIDHRYELDIQIHSGRWGEVFRATDRRNDRPVAVRFFPTTGQGLAQAKPFAQHVKRLSSLSAPGLSVPIDHGVEEGIAYTISRWAAGQTLADRLAERGALDLEQTLTVMEALLRALSKGHEMGLTHGLLRPAKIVVDDLDSARAHITIVDFQVWKLFELATAEKAFEESKLSRRIVRYCAPEVIQNHGVVPASDVYSLGLLAIEMLTGRPAFDDNHRIALIARQLDPEAVELSFELGAGESFRGFLAQLLAKEAAERIPDACEAFSKFKGQRDLFISEPPARLPESVEATEEEDKFDLDEELFGREPSEIDPIEAFSEDPDENLRYDDVDPSDLFGEGLNFGDSEGDYALEEDAEEETREEEDLMAMNAPRHAPNSSLMEDGSGKDFDDSIADDIETRSEKVEPLRAPTPVPPRREPRPPRTRISSESELSLSAMIAVALVGLLIIGGVAFFVLMPSVDPASDVVAEQDNGTQVEPAIRHKMVIHTSPPALRVQVPGRPGGLSPLEIEVGDEEFPLQVQARLNAEQIITHTVERPEPTVLIDFEQ